MSSTIHSLYSYPIKSCAGLRHDRITVSESGVAHDRHWVVVDRYGCFMTQRQYPGMVLIRPEPTPMGLWLRGPGQTDCFSPTPGPEAPAVSVSIFGTPTLGADQGDEAARWLSAFLHTECRLLHVHPQVKRPADPDYVAQWLDAHPEWPGFSPAGRHHFAFADGFPFLVANTGSLEELNQQLATAGALPVDMIRFRPNIVLDGLAPYDEDYLAGFHTGKASFAFVKACARCAIPNVDPQTGLAAREPGLTLARHRQFQQGVLFAMNAVVSAPDGTSLQIGDSVEPVFDFQ